MTARRPNTRPDRGPGVGLEPVPGLYKTRLVQGGPWLPARIWYGAPLDPETGQPLARAHRLNCVIAGEAFDPLERWPMHPIDRAEYDRLVAAMPDDPRQARPLAAEPPLF